MKAHEYAAATPLDMPPTGPTTPQSERREALEDALRGVELGAHDQRAVRWLTRHLDDSTMKVVVGWLLRVRAAGAIGVLDLEVAIQEQARANATQDGPLWGESASGPGGPL